MNTGEEWVEGGVPSLGLSYLSDCFTRLSWALENKQASHRLRRSPGPYGPRGPPLAHTHWNQRGWSPPPHSPASHDASVSVLCPALGSAQAGTEASLGWKQRLTLNVFSESDGGLGLLCFIFCFGLVIFAFVFLR